VKEVSRGLRVYISYCAIKDSFWYICLKVSADGDIYIYSDGTIHNACSDIGRFESLKDAEDVCKIYQLDYTVQ